MRYSFWGVFFAFALTHYGHAYIYDIRILERPFPGLAKKQYVIGFCDFHNRSLSRVVAEQRSMLERLCKKANNKALHFFVEDLSSPNTEGTFSCVRYRADTRGGFLGGITDFLRKHHCKVDNLEFRYCRVASLGLSLAGSTSPQALKMLDVIQIGQFVDETQKILNKNNSYKDSALASWNTKQVNLVKNAMQHLALEQHREHSVREYLDFRGETSPSKRVSLLEELVSYDSPLFDVMLAHALFNDHDHDTLVVLAGGTHVQETFNILAQQGFKRISVEQRKLAGVNMVDAVYNQGALSLPIPVSLSITQPFWPKK